jgi:integrase
VRRTHGSRRPRKLPWIEPRLGHLKLNEVTARRLDTLVVAMADTGRKPRTIRNTLGALRGLLRLAKRYGYVSAVPEFPHIRLDHTRRHVHIFEDGGHLLRLARDWSDPASLAVIALALDAGLRAGEILQPLLPA